MSTPGEELHARSHPRRVWPTVGALAVLSAVALFLGAGVSADRRPVPEGSLAPGPLPAPVWWLLFTSTIVCLVVAVLLTRRSVPLSLRSRAGVAWLVVLVLGAVAGVIDAAGVAINAPLPQGPPIPVFHWLFTALPAVLAAVVSGASSSRGRAAAALGTGVVTLPLLAVTWALAGVGPALDRLPAAVWSTVLLGAVPLALAVAVAAGSSQGAALSGPPPTR